MQTSRVTVNVTEGDIAKATRGNSHACAVAIAVARAFPDVTRINVDMQTIRFTVDGERLVYLTPYRAQLYIIAFDAGDELEPFRFVLRDPLAYKRRAYTEAGRAVNAARQAGRPRPPVAGPLTEVVPASPDALPETRTPLRAASKVRHYGHRAMRDNQ